MAANKPGTLQLANEEYEAQFFGFLPSSLMESIVGRIADRMTVAVDEVEENLSKIPETVLGPEELKRGMERLRSTTVQQTDKILTKLHHHLTGEILRVPSHLLLPCDLEQSKPATLQDVANIEHQIQDLHTQLKNELYLQAVLKDETKEAKKLLQHQVSSQCESAASMAFCSSMQDNLSFLGDNINKQKQALSCLQRSSDTVVRWAQQDDIDLSSVPSQRQVLEDNMLS